jgi:hypothetical protein
MAEDKIYLSVAREKRQPQNDGYIATLSLGQPQLGDLNVTVLTLTVVKNMKAAKQWHAKMLKERPWETRQ